MNRRPVATDGARVGQGGWGITEPVGDKRHPDRSPVLKAAKILFGNSVVDCLVLDMSDKGVRVGTDGMMPFPETVTVELRSGGKWEARRRWQRGTETGLEFIRFAGLNQEAAAQVAVLHEMLRNAGVRDVTARLAAVRHYDHQDLARAAEAAERALDALEQTLEQAARPAAPGVQT